MNRNILALTLLVVCAGTLSCQKQAKNSSETDTTLAKETLSEAKAKEGITLVASTKDFKDKYATASYFILYPQKNDTSVLAKSIRTWVKNTINRKYKGDISDADAMMTWNEKQFMKQAKKELQESGGVNGDSYTGYGSFDSIYVSYKTNKIISMVAFCYVSTVGAHGLAGASYNTFHALSGKSYGWNMIKDKKALQTFLKSGLKKYFEVSTDKELQDQLLIIDNNFSVNTIPLPEYPPYFTKEGLTLSYSSYEIAPYSAGMPYVVIPFNQLDNILIPEVLALIK